MEPIKIKTNITKKGVINFSQILTIILIFAVYVMSDYIKASGDMSFISAWEYWSVLIITLCLVVAIMVTVRSLRKQSRLEQSTDILANLRMLTLSFRTINSNGFNKKLNEFLKSVNEENKYQAFIRSIQKKIQRTRNEEKIEELENLLELPKEEVLKKYVKFKKVTRIRLFSGIDGRTNSEDDFDISAHNGRDIGEMIGIKALLVFLFSAFTGTLIVNFVFDGISAIFGTLLKVASLIVACNTAMNTADNYVDCNVREAMQKRITIVSNFVNENEDLKELLFKAKEKDCD